MLRPARFSICAASTVTSGLLASLSRRVMREPVTTTFLQFLIVAFVCRGRDRRIAEYSEAANDRRDHGANGNSLARNMFHDTPPKHN